MDGFHALVGLHEVGAPPCLAHVVAILEVEFPSVPLVAGGRDEATLVEDGFLFDGDVKAVGQLLAAAPCLAAIFRAHHPSFPASHVGTDFEIEQEFAGGEFVEHGVPACFAVVAAEDAVGHHLRLRPLLCTFRLATHPDAHVGIALFRATEIGGHQVALARLHDAGGVAFGEGSSFVEEFVHHHLRAAFGQVAYEVPRAGAYLLPFATGEAHSGCGVGRCLNVPVEFAVLLAPFADDGAVDGVVATLDVVELIDGEVGLEQEFLETGFCGTDADHVFIEPGEEVAQ